jgi:SAM-dependent methyltransferase
MSSSHDTAIVATPAADWSAVAAGWDAHVDHVDDHSTAATEAMLGALAIKPGERVLELACGPGSLGAALSSRVGVTGNVVLSDIAPGMVEVARRRNSHHDQVEVAVIDAASIDRPDGAFDVVLSRMGLMFTPDPAEAFAEIHRVLAPGGRVAAMTWAGIEHNPWMTCIGIAAMTHGLSAGGPPTGPGGIFSLGDPATLEAVAGAAGLSDVLVTSYDIVFHAATVGEHLDRVCSLAGPLATVIASAPAQGQAAVRQTAGDLLAPHVADDGTVAVPGRALLLVGRR